MDIIANKINMHVGSRLRKRRAALGLTQTQLAEALGISYQQVQKYETGSNRITAGRLFVIANLLEVDVSFFFNEIDPMMSSSSLGHGGEHRAAIELVNNFNRIENHQIKTSVCGLVRTLADPKEFLDHSLALEDSARDSFIQKGEEQTQLPIKK
ncbi:MAG: helix-turn-helix domain-containing protein [Sneathiellales bacterium]|nr:helix-turn-helix domain-containing protein [Sneathiellales bacterium]